MFTSFLIKYAEIGIKGKNRYLFEDALVRQIKYALKKCEGEFLVHKTQGRIFVDAESEFDYDEVVAHLQRVFGISGICPVVRSRESFLRERYVRRKNCCFWMSRYPELTRMAWNFFLKRWII